jgi:hypothetical protein
MAAVLVLPLQRPSGLPSMPQSPSFAQESASFIGKSLASSAISFGGALAIGSILSAAGVDLTGSAAILAQLAEVNRKLDELLVEVKALRSEFLELSAKNDYDILAAAVQPLMNRNNRLLRIAKSIAELRQAPSPNLAAIAILEAEFTAALDADGYGDGVETWYNTLCGISDQTSLIEAWNRRVVGAQPLFTPRTSRAIQAHWDLMDYHQAVTLAMLSNKYPTGSPLRKQLLIQFQAYRAEEIALLRGGEKTLDIFNGLDPATLAEKEFRTPLANAFPANTIWYEKDGTSLMGYLVLSPPVPLHHVNDHDPLYEQPFVGAATTATGKSDWSLLKLADTQRFISGLGGSAEVGGGRKASFNNALRKNGFNYGVDAAGKLKPLDTNCKLWVRAEGVIDDVLSKLWPISVLLEGDTWSEYAWKHTDAEANIMLLRVVLTEEGNRYRYR